MPASTDFLYQDTANPPLLGTETNIGGARTASGGIVFTQEDTDGTIEMLSSNAGDTGNVSIEMVTGGGVNALVTETQALNGTSVVAFTNTVGKIKIITAAAHSGTITIRKSSGGATLATLAPSVTRLRCLSPQATSSPSGAKVFYDSFFVLNNHSTEVANGMVVAESADPTTRVEFGIAATANTSTTNGSGNNQEVAFSGITYDNSDKTFGNLSAGAALQVFTKITLPQDAVAFKNTWSIAVRWTNG